MASGYAVLDYYDSESSSAIHQVRRGGDGVLYCTCRGWVSNLNAQRRAQSPEPAQCRHTKDYVAKHPEKGTPNVDLGLYRGDRLVKVLTVTIPPAWKIDPSALVGRVVEAAGWEIWPLGALRSAQLGHRSGPRDDKRPEDCTHAAAMEA